MNEKNVLEPIRIPIHKALTQPVLIAGAERELTILVSFMTAIVWVAGKDFFALILAVTIWFVGNLFSRAAAKEESQRTKIFARHIKYKKYYPATEKTNSLKVSVKTFKV